MWSALFSALIERGANVEARAAKETTGLMYAAFTGHAEIVRMLLDNEGFVEVNTADVDGHTALHFAARFARFRALSFILDLEKPFFGASGGRGRAVGPAACSSFA